MQRRLADLGFDPGEQGHFDRATSRAVVAFQQARGLRADGECGAQTWAVLLEAGYRLGDRWLYLTSPMIRGDDVASLQRRLGGLGFDAGHVDGIFGPDTQRAVEDFQRNAGLTVDGICGPATFAALARLGRRCDDAEPVAGIRQWEALTRPERGLNGCRVCVAHAGGLSALAAAIRRSAASRGATVAEVAHPDGAVWAARANQWRADAVIGVAILDEPGSQAAYFRGTNWESSAGRRLAGAIQAGALATCAVPDRGIAGMALPALRETRMPAVIWEIGPAAQVVEHGEALAQAVGRALESWIADARDD